MNVLDIISKVGAREATITKMEFISPVFYNTTVATRVCGIVYTFRIPKTNPGWYKIRPVNPKEAVITGNAGLDEIEKYLSRLTKFRATLAWKKDSVYHALADKNSLPELAGQALPVLLFDDSVQDFDRIICRTDGANAWYESPDTGNDPSKSEYLRQSLKNFIQPEKIKFSGLVFDEKAAYAYRVGINEQFRKLQRKQTLQDDVEHAGGKLIEYEEKSDHYSVTYDVDGETFTSYVSKDPTHKVITAGICLAGTDALFDLKSLVTVVRQGKKERRIHRTLLTGSHEDNDDEDYED